MTELAADTFTRADAASLGANWTVNGTLNPFGIFSNAADAATLDAYLGHYYSAITWPNDYYVQATVLNLTTPRMQSVAMRMNASAWTFYGAGVNSADEANNLMRLWKRVAGTYTSLGAGASTVSSGQVIRGEVEGTTIRAILAGVTEVSTTDSSIVSGNAGMVGYVSSGNGDIPLLDDWSGGDLAVIPPPAPVYVYPRWRRV